MIRQAFHIADTFSPPPPFSRSEPCSHDILAHYSFDMAQQVHYPSDPLQPGPIYFLTPRKCAIFGMCCESIPRQINYLIDEASDTGKGSNTIVSMLHHFFEEHGLGETMVHLHADNCVGQNKNNTMLQYLIWRVMVGLHKRIALSFLIVGHTKFSPDWCFGLLKRRFRRTKVGCLADLERVVDDSAEANVPQLVGTQSGEVVVPMYDWTSMFKGHLRKLKHIKKYQHFTFDGSMPGTVNFKLESDSVEESISLVIDRSWVPSPHDLPPVVSPAGLSLERQWYLYNSISEYCPHDVRDIVCPKPSSPSPSSSTTSAVPTTSSAVPTTTPTLPAETRGEETPASIALTESSHLEPANKRRRVCSKCKVPGHNARTCGN